MRNAVTCTAAIQSNLTKANTRNLVADRIEEIRYLVDEFMPINLKFISGHFS